jgi:hypothetical protein
MYFIYNCNDVVVGNPKGYATYKGALKQAEYGLAHVHIQESYNFKYLYAGLVTSPRKFYSIKHITK